MRHVILSADAVKMEYFRRYPASKLTRVWASSEVMIRSSGGLWRPEGEGYTNVKSEAGVFTLRDACKHTFHCGPEKSVVFLAIHGTVGNGILPTQEAEKWISDRAIWLA